MKIAQIRKTKHITQAELAQKCQTTQQTIAKIETGVVDPRLSTLSKLADALGYELKDLFYTKTEFVNEVNHVIRKHKLNPKKMGLLTLNGICAKEAHIPASHPYWEKILPDHQSVQLKEQK